MELSTYILLSALDLSQQDTVWRAGADHFLFGIYDVHTSLFISSARSGDPFILGQINYLYLGQVTHLSRRENWCIVSR